MGLFNRNSNQNQSAVNQNQYVERQDQPVARQSRWEEQKIGQDDEKMKISQMDNKQFFVAEYYSGNSKSKKFYDTTRLVVDTVPSKVNGVPVYSAYVAWYGQNDCVYLGDNGKDMGRRNQFTEVKLQLDMQKLYRDPRYQRILAEGLLDQNRVQRYMKDGLSENPERKCGNYIGGIGITPNTGNYCKVFNTNIGRIIHDSPTMVATRQKHRAEQERKRQQEMARKQAQIKKLQKEMRELE